MRPPVIPRVALLALALAACAWLAAGLVASDGLKGAGEVVAEAQGEAGVGGSARGGPRRARARTPPGQ